MMLLQLILKVGCTVFFSLGDNCNAQFFFLVVTAIIISEEVCFVPCFLN
jgi:hypothetical protein